MINSASELAGGRENSAEETIVVQTRQIILDEMHSSSQLSVEMSSDLGDMTRTEKEQSTTLDPTISVSQCNHGNGELFCILWSAYSFLSWSRWNHEHAFLLFTSSLKHFWARASQLGLHFVPSRSVPPAYRRTTAPSRSCDCCLESFARPPSTRYPNVLHRFFAKRH